jgi:molecular chaperone DnaK (HSP70)
MSDRQHGVIGIDLGTTYSAVAVYDKFNEQAELLENVEAGNGATTPSVVGLDPVSRKVIVGMAAKRNLAFDAANTIIEIKREMGDVFSEATLDKYNARSKCRAGEPVRVAFNGDWYRPQEISAFTLMRIKEVAEAAMGRPVNDAVITVPAYFTEKQKKATEEAALLAGLYPRQLIPEPTAAAICYGVDRLEPTRKVYLVYDLGGGTFDVSIIAVEETKIDVISTSGDPRLGGGDFDDAIVNWTVQQLREQHGLDVAADPSTQRTKLAQIKAHAEQAKKELSSFQAAKMSFLDVWPERPPTVEITRQQFESLIEQLLSKSLNYVDTAIQAAEKKGIRREDVNAILLVGGSSKIPRVKQLLLEYFGQDESFVRADLDPDAVVARGAAIMAQRFAPTPGDFNIAKRPDASQMNASADDEITVNLITEHSLGVGVQDELVSRIIDQGTNIPVSKKQGGFTNGGLTRFVQVPVYQGEGQKTFENTLIGKLELGPMEEKPAGHHNFEVTFSLDENGLLTMTVDHVNEGKSYQAKFQQETAVGGVEALAALRAKLHKMFVKTPGTATPHIGPPTAPARAAPPAAPVAPQAVASPTAPAPPSMPAPPSAPVPPSSPVPPSAPAQVASPPMPTAPPAAPAGDGLVLPTVEVPAEFKSIVRRSQKLILERPSPRLVAALNKFVTSLNRGAASDDLEELGDELADVYEDSRR